MKKITNILSLMLLTVATSAVLSGCKLLNEQDRVVAEVGPARLMLSEIQTIAEGYTGDDSLQVINNHIDAWVRKEVKMQEARRVLADQLDDIDRLVEEYRTSLMSNRLERIHIEQSLADTLITDSLLMDYFLSHRSEFILDRTILKGRIVRLPENYRQHAKVSALMGSKSKEKQQDFLDLCVKNNFEILTFDSWVDFSDFLSYLPVRRDKNYDYVLKSKSIREMSDDESRYFIQITNVLYKGEQAPYERAEAMVRKLVFNRLRGEQIADYNDSLYNAAIEQQIVKIHATEQTTQQDK